MSDAPKAPRRVHLDFVGCRLNQAEIEQMGRSFRAQGDEIVGEAAEADLVVVNTCAVTHEAARKSRRMIRGAGRANPDSEIVVTGCYAELQPDTLSALPNVSQVIGNLEKDSLVAILNADGVEVSDFDREPISREPLPPGTIGRTRAFLKVQDGCDNKCTFCITTVARGQGRSRPVEAIIEEVNLLGEMGYQEIVLTGVHLGSYGHDLGDPNGLYGLVKAILSQTTIPRIRLSSLEPWDLSAGFFDLWDDPRVCPHLHLPLQSGCDATLKRMARRTSQESFRALVDAARSQIPDLNLTTDLIVGFPGETDADFEESIRYVQEIGFGRLHVFSYSLREGTAAAAMPNHVPDDVKKGCRARMVALSDQLQAATRQAVVGKRQAVLWESVRAATPAGFVYAGFTGNYLRVLTTSREDLTNTITSAQIDRLEDDGLWATLD